MAKIPGKNAFLYNGAQKIVSMTDYTMKVEEAQIDSYDHDSGGWDESIGGAKKWTATATHNYVLGDASQLAVRSALLGSSVLTVNFYPDGIGAGLPIMTGQCKVSDYTLKAPNTGIQTLDLSLVSQGPLTESTQ